MPNNSSLTIVRASAGSGKTYTLAVRFVAHLIANADKTLPHREMLAITFTNKATSEMKERILSFLDKLAKQQDKDLLENVKNEWRKTGVQVTDVPEKAAKVLEGLLNDYSNFSVLTIDSFFQRILHTVAYELGLLLNSRVEIQTDDAIAEAVDELLQNPAADKDVFNWLLGYVEREMEDNSSWSLKKDMGDFAKSNLMKDDYQLLTDKEKNALNDSVLLKDYENNLRKKRRDAENNILNLSESTLQKISPYKDKLARWGDYEGFFSKLKTLFDNSKPRSAYKNVSYSAVRKSIEGKANSGKPLFLSKFSGPATDADEQYVRAALEQLLKGLAANYSDVLTARLILENIRPLRLLLDMESKLDEVLRLNNTLLLSRTKLIFHRMIGDDDVPFVFERVGTRYNYIMIDEFQDTALTQWKNLKKLLLNNMASGFSCLVVGDIKQSIYRWNNGDWRILYGMHTEQEITRLCQPNVETLKDNYRTLSNVVGFNNSLFPALGRHFDKQFGTNQCEELYAEATTVQNPKKGQGGYVRFCFYPARSKVVYGKSEHSLASQMQRLHDEGIKWNDMAILVRQKKTIAAIKDHLYSQIEDIHLVTSEMFQYAASQLVLAIMATLRWLYANRQYVGNVAECKYDSVSAAYMVELRARLAVMPVQPAVHPDSDDYPDLRRAFANVLDEAEMLLSLPLVELCHRVIELLDLDELVKREDAFLLSFFDEVGRYVGREGNDLAAFLDYFDEVMCEKTIPATQVDGVKIMTLHKAKGLEFHTVLIPEASWEVDSSTKDGKSYYWFQPTESPFNQYQRVPVKMPKEIANSKSFCDQYEEEMNEKRIDCLNMAYVAFTRPKQNLLVWASNQQFGAHLQAAMKEVTGVQTNTADVSDEEGNTCQVQVVECGEVANLQPAPADSSKHDLFDDNSQAISFVWQTNSTLPRMRQSNRAKDYLATSHGSQPQWRALIEHGKLCHKIMELTTTAADVDKAVNTVYRLGLCNDEERKKLVGEFREYVRQPDAAEWFDGSWTVHNETTFLCAGGSAAAPYRAKRPDRIMTRGDETVVVDFKFSADTNYERYRPQVREYMHLLRSVGHANVKGYLWYPEQQKVVAVE
ncbi:MAG: UvrD-helicase domain-containing protein [Alloprevotella sp.]|nr:UvrD-helicase domain-containing protein [Alloprevotella sp.]